MPMPNPRQYLTISQQNNTIMLPRRIAIAAQNNNSNVARLNAAFVADNSIGEVNPELKLKQYNVKEEEEEEEDEQQQLGEYDDDTKSISASGNIEAETNKLELVDNDEFDKYKSGDDSSASASNTIVRKDRLTMEYNEETEEQKNLNESSVDFDETENWNSNGNGNGNENQTVDGSSAVEDEDEKNHEFQVTTPLELSIATDEEFVVAVQEDNNNNNNNNNDEEKKHAFEEAIEKITTTSTTAEDFDHSEVEVEVVVPEEEEEEENDEVEAVSTGISHLNLAINRDREYAESLTDEDETHIEMSEAFNTEWAELDEIENLANSSSGSEIDDNVDSNEIHVPADLSNDIIVNDYVAAHNVPFNPDAEFIDVTSTTLKNSSMPIFENLSIK